ncbi:MAG: LamG-like jellyroll fold domain-containing protein [Bacteroidota bacterium]|jgi:hypothetical protein
MNYAVIAASIKKTIISRKTKFLTAALLIAASSAFAQVPSYVPTNGLVGWWPFNGNANDESGNGNNGTVNGATLSTDRLGTSNSSYQFSLSTSRIIINNNFYNNGLSDYSISVWFNPANNLVNGCLINTIPHDGFGISYSYYGTNKKIYHYKNSNPANTNHLWDIFDASAFNYPQFDFNIWYNIIIVKSGNNYSYYVNGNLDRSVNSSQTAIQYNCGLSIGNIDPNIGSEPFNGKLDDIAIWNRALTQQEITALYNAQSCTSNTITADGPTTFCSGNYANLTSDVVGGTYQWKKNGVNVTTNGTSRTYKATATGSYTCVATCNGTALTSNAIQVTTKTNAFASVTASGATSFCAGDSVTLNCTNLGSNYSVQWYRTNISIENATNYSLVVKQPGTYKVVTKNLTTGCSRISGSAITTNVNCRIAGDVTSGSVIQENTNTDTRFMDNELSQGVHIFPNPNSGVFSFNYDGEETGEAVLQIINNMGQSIYQSRLTVPEGGFTQDLQLGDNITKGIYIVRLLINDSYHDSKVMVK